MPEPPRSQLRRLLDRPDAHPRVRRAVVSLLTASIAAIAALGILIIWHLVRRARLIRERLNPPRPIRWPSVAPDDRAGTNEPEPEPELKPEPERREP